MWESFKSIVGKKGKYAMQFLPDDPVSLLDGSEGTVIKQFKLGDVKVKKDDTNEIVVVKPNDLTLLWEKFRGDSGWSDYADLPTYEFQGTNPPKTYIAKSFKLACEHYMTEFKLNDTDSVYLTSKSYYRRDHGDIQPPTVACYLDQGWLELSMFWFTGEVSRDDDLYDPSETPTMYIDWRDMGTIPVRELSQAVIWCLRRVKEGERLSIGCHGAHGRTGTLLASILVHEGSTATDAIARVRKEYCSRAIETNGQEKLVEDYSKALIKQETENGQDDTNN